MGDPITAVAVGSLVLGAVSTFSQLGAASRAAQGEIDAAAKNAALQQTEATRQQEETNRTAVEDKSDVIRRANYELGTIRATAGELGAGGSSLGRLATELGTVTGTDLARIEGNRQGAINSLQSQKVAARQGALNTISSSYNSFKAQRTSAILGFAGTALQIGGQYYKDQRALELQKNRVQE
jgi:hypothetical protein